MSDFSSSPYGTGPFGYPYTVTPPQEQASIPASRYIDANGRFKQKNDGTGAMVGMNDTVQRAMVLLALNVPRVAKIGASFASETEANVRKALEPLTSTERVLEIEEIQAIDNGTSQTAVRIVLRDLIDGQIHELVR